MGNRPKRAEQRAREGSRKKGRLDARRVTELLREEGIDVLVSSPYARSVMTIQELADQAGKEIIVYEGLKERKFDAGEHRISDRELHPLLDRSFADPHYALPGGESNAACQKRAIGVLQEILEVYRGQKIAIGTHGAVMMLMMGHYDSRFGLEFLLQLTKPDVYRMQFDGQELIEVKRLWAESANV